MLNALGQQPGGQARTADLPPTPFLRTPPNAPQPIQFDSPMEAIAGLEQGLQQLKAGQLTLHWVDHAVWFRFAATLLHAPCLRNTRARTCSHPDELASSEPSSRARDGRQQPQHGPQQHSELERWEAPLGYR